MNDNEQSWEQSLRGRLFSFWWLLFGLSAAEGIAALVGLLFIPSDPKSQFLLGYSLERWVLIASIFVLSLFFVLLAVKSRRDMDFRTNWLDPERRKRLFVFLLVGAVSISVISWCVLFVLKLYPEGKYFAYFERLLPLLSWLFVIGIQFTVWLAVVRFGLHREGLASRRGMYVYSGVVALAFILVGVFAGWTGIGIAPDLVDWNGPGAPLLEWQIWLAWVMGVAVLVMSISRKQVIVGGEKRSPDRWLDVVIAAAFWILAVILWNQQPITRTYFTPETRPPNYEIYPYSDAANHDIAAQYVLIGNGLMNRQVVKRPLLSTFFVGLHVLGGQDYQKLIFIQTFFLALFPVLMYFVGKALYGRPLGVMLAMLALLREVNTIAASPFDAVSHSKMLMSDLPAAIGISIFVLWVIYWLKGVSASSSPTWNPLALVSGGVLGLVMLVRPQSVLIAFFILPSAWLIMRKNWRKWVAGIVLFVIGLFMAVAPWLWRNWGITGEIVFEQSAGQTSWVAQRYSAMPNDPPARLSGESDEEYEQRLYDAAKTYMIAHPWDVASFITAHFLNNEFGTLLILPVRDSFVDLRDVVGVTRKFWDGLDSGLTGLELLILVLNLAILSVGIAASYSRWKLLGILPLLVNLAYSLSNAIARNSGWRYMLPADWVGYLYYCIGLLEIASWVLILMGMGPGKVDSFTLSPGVSGQQKRRLMPNAFWRSALIALGFFLIGATIPLAEKMFPERYPLQSELEILDKFENLVSTAQTEIDMDALDSLVTDEEVVVLRGMALYPRYYYPGQGESGTRWTVYMEKDYRHLGFLLIGHQESMVSLALESPPEFFPNGAEAIVIGCQQEGYVEGLLIALVDGGGVVYHSSNGYLQECW